VRRLIVNADDFGLTPGINRAVVDLHDAGALGSTTLMADGPHFDAAAAMSRQHPALGIGCHIVLVDGTPTAHPDSIPTLLGLKNESQSAPAFRQTLGIFVRDLHAGRITRADIEREATAQICRLQQAGISVTHVDTHKHTHMFPAVLDAVVSAALACGIRAIRNPFEPRWSVAITPNAGLLRRLQVRVLLGYRRYFRRQILRQNLLSTDGCLGVLATGTLDETALRAIVERMPDGLWELVCHPAHLDDVLRATRTRLQESRATEFAALQALPALLANLSHPVDLTHFGHLV
jgi:predicted glycoside hydrolase/deacetylase ChbG (UPF0249 family)